MFRSLPPNYCIPTNTPKKKDNNLLHDMYASEENQQKEKQTAHATDVHMLFVDTEPKFGSASGVQHMSATRE